MTSLTDLAARLLCVCGVPAFARWKRSRQLAILMFHGVEAQPLSPHCSWVIDTAGLRRDLEYVRRHFTVLPLEEALARLDDGTLPRRAAALTFDDGTRNLLTHAAPILRDLGMPASVFLATGPMGTDEVLWPDRLWHAFALTAAPEVDLRAVGLDVCSLRTEAERVTALDALHRVLKLLPDAERMAQVEDITAALRQEFVPEGGPFELLSWDEATALSRGGLVTLHPHTVTHPILSRCDDEKVEYEISESCRMVQRNTGRAPTVFAYPNGGEQDYDQRAKAVLRRNGIRWSLSTTNGYARRDSDPLALPRIGLAAHQSDAVFRLKVSGFAPRPRRTAGAADTEIAADGANTNRAGVS